MLRLILAGSLLAIGSASLDPDGLLPDQLKQPEELPPNPNRRIPNNREAEEEVSNLLSQLEGTAAGNMTIWGENERPDGPFIRKNGTSGRKHAVFGPRNSLVTGNGTKVVPAPHDNKDFEKKLLGIEPTGKHADILNLKLFGEFGKNYFTEYGKAYINCAVSDVERPLLEAVNSTEGRTKKCFIEWGRSFERLACMAVFMYKGTAEELKNDPNPRENMVVQNQNCWNNQEAAIETCTKASKCMFNGMIEAGKQHFCCCNEHNCNDVIDYDPNATEEDDEAILEKEKLEMAEKQKRIQAIAEAQHRKVVAIIVSVFAGIAMLGLAVITFCCCRKHRNKRKENSAVHTELLLPNDLELGSKVDRPWEIINSSLEEIGQGKYGRVYKAQFRDRADAPLMTVAVKTYKSGNTASYHNELAIYNELCMKKCQKDCILRLIQFDLQEKLLITEYYEMGNLHQYLEKFTIEQPLDTLSLIISLLEALSFLHEERGPMSQDPKPVILHRDIKSHNVLLRVDSRNRLVGVLMDFGLSLKCSQATQDSQATTNQMHKVVGTQRYMAPELLVGSAELDIAHFKAIDVYAMALVLWEIVTRTRVTPTEEVPIYSEPLERELRKEQPNDPLKLSTYRHVVAAKKLRPSFRKAVQNDRLLSKVQNSIEEMWEHDAGCRVSAACVQKRMEVVFDEGYHSGTMDVPGSLRSTSSDAEKTPPSGRSSTHSDTNKTVVIEADETLSGEVEEAVDTVNEAARLLGHKNNNLPPEGEAIELEMR